MDIEGIEITFEPRVPVVGQTMILEALDYIYSVIAVGEVGVRDDPSLTSRLGELASDLPGKLLRPEHVLTVEYARTGSVKEGLSGVLKSLKALLEFLATYRVRVEQEKAKLAREKLRIIREELLPTIDKLKKRGLSDEDVSRVLEKLYLFTEDVLTPLMERRKLSLAPVEKLPKPGKPCPTCNGMGSVP
jgi:hypothetical protein